MNINFNVSEKNVLFMTSIKHSSRFCGIVVQTVISFHTDEALVGASEFWDVSNNNLGVE